MRGGERDEMNVSLEGPIMFFFFKFEKERGGRLFLSGKV